MTTFERIKKISKKRGYSLRQTAEKAGMGETSLYHWKYKTPNATSLAKVAKALNVSTDYLLNGDKTKKSPKSIDLDDDDAVMTFEGKPIPDKYKELFKDILKRMDNYNE